MNLETVKTQFSRKFDLIFAALILIAVGLGCSGTKPELPSTDAQNALVKQTMKDFSKGVQDENFSAFVQTTSKEFQAQLPADKVKAAFQTMIDKKEIAVPIMESAGSMSPQYSSTPAIREEKGNYILQLKGNFPTAPVKTDFDFQYVWQDSQWKLLLIEVRM